MPRELIHLNRVQKIFLTEEIETHALIDIDLRIERGEYVAVSGPSGCGKSTLLSILGLLDTPTSGTYHLAGEAVAQTSAAQRARIRNERIGFIFQNFNLIGDLTVSENVALPLRYRGVPGREAAARVERALRRVDMLRRRDHYPAQLSGGQQQRVAVARALVGEPVILLADEPTGNLDSQNGAAVMDLLDELHEQGSTIAMVTHDPDYAQRAKRQVHLFDGRIVSDDGDDRGAENGEEVA